MGGRRRLALPVLPRRQRMDRLQSDTPQARRCDQPHDPLQSDRPHRRKLGQLLRPALCRESASDRASCGRGVLGNTQAQQRRGLGRAGRDIRTADPGGNIRRLGRQGPRETHRRYLQHGRRRGHRAPRRNENQSDSGREHIRRQRPLRPSPRDLQQRDQQDRKRQHADHRSGRQRYAGPRNRAAGGRGRHRILHQAPHPRHSELRGDGRIRVDGNRYLRRQVRIRAAQKERPREAGDHRMPVEERSRAANR